MRSAYKRLPTTRSKQLSSVVRTNSRDDKKDKSNCNTILLYQRDPERNTLTRASFFVSSLNSLYWLWYVADFVPAVNSSPVNNFHIDPIYGFGGLGLSVLIQSAFTVYPLSLVSKIALREPNSSLNSNSSSVQQKNSVPKLRREILVWKYALPLLEPSSKPLIFPVGDITIDRTSDNTRMILEELEGDIGRFEGFLGLKRVSKRENKTGQQWNSYLTINLPLLLDIRNPSDVCNSDLILQALLSEAFKHHRKKDIGGEQYGEEIVTKNHNKLNQERRKYQQKKGYRRRNRRR